MQEKLVIYLQASAPLKPSWAVVDGEGVIRQSAWQDESEGLSQIAEGKEIIVLVPSEDISLFSLTLPKMNRSRLMQALPFALEEQLISDLASLHFVPGPYQENGELPVCVLAHEKLQTWLQQLKTWQIEPNCVLPDLFALPYAKGEWQAAIHEVALVRTGRFQGFACDKNNLGKILALAESGANEPPRAIKIKQYGDEALSLNSNLLASVEVENTSQCLMQDLAKHATLMENFNLLSGQYAVKKSRLPQAQKMGKLSAYLAAATLALFLFYPLGSYLILSSKLSSLDQQIAQIYKRQFPQASSIVAPKMRMEEKLKKLTSQSGDSKLLSLMGYLGKGMTATKNIKLKRVDFQNGQLNLELTAASSEDFSQFTDAMTQLGLLVKQQNANLNGDRLNANLTIEM